MKTIDFTQPGGFPLTQDQLGYLQTAYTEVIPALLAYRNPGTNVAVRISGMAVTVAGPTTTVSAGWFLYNATLIRFTGGSWSLVLPGNAIYVQITNSTSSLTFADGSTPGVIKDVTATTTSLPSSTPDGSSAFLFAHLQDFSRESAWTTQTFTSYVTGLSVSGTIKYKKNYLANTLSLVGSLTTPGAIDLSGISGYIDGVGNGTLMFTLPSGYIPNNKASFIMDIEGGSFNAWEITTNPSGSLAGITMMANNFVGTVNTDGKVYIKFLNGGEPATYYWTFNIVISLD